MKRIKKSGGFRLEVRLGLALIILILLILNTASHYTIYRVSKSLEGQIQETLTEAAVKLANRMETAGRAEIDDSLKRAVMVDYDLESLHLIRLDYDRVLAINRGEAPDTAFLAFDSALSSRELGCLLINRPLYHHRAGEGRYILLFPTEIAGSKYVAAVSRKAALLGSLEKAMKTLIFFAILTGIVLVIVSARFVRSILNPFNRLKEKAEESGRLEPAGGDEISRLVESYEKIINDLKAKEEELVELNRRIAQRAENLAVYNDYILRTVDSGIVTLKTDKSVSTINRAATTMMRINPGDGSGENYHDIFSEFTDFVRLVDQYFAGDRTIVNREIRLAEPGGSGRTLTVTITRLDDGGGEEIGVVILMIDQTEYLRLQEELELSRRLATLGEMSGGLAHQLRNSMGAVLGFARLITRHSGDDAAVGRNTEALIREAMQAEALVARFLDYARPMEVGYGSIFLGRFLDDLKETAETRFESACLEINNRPADDFTFTGDDLLLKQALGNIIDNACQAAADRAGQVIIRAEADGNNLRIIISDDGPGIPDEYRDKIFTPFFSGSPSGSGLGLPLSQKIVGLHGGQIGFRSSAAEGTVFTVTLPLVSGPVAGAASRVTAGRL